MDNERKLKEIRGHGKKGKRNERTGKENDEKTIRK